MAIIKDEELLRQPSEPVQNVKEGFAIAKKLVAELVRHKNGVGLSAPQIGIFKQVFIINVKRPYIFINSVIQYESADYFIAEEGCLSFPGLNVQVRRHAVIEISTLNHGASLHFSVGGRLDALECACVQHEYDHTLGVLYTDRMVL